MSAHDTPFISNPEVARILFQTAALLEMMEFNPFRVRAYRRAALGVLFSPRPVVDAIAGAAPPDVPGIGEGMWRKLADLANTGHMETHDMLIDEVGEPLASLLLVPGVGPKTAMRLVRELNVTSLAELEDAAASGRVQSLRGFGPKREARIADAVRTHLAGAA